MGVGTGPVQPPLPPDDDGGPPRKIPVNIAAAFSIDLMMEIFGAGSLGSLLGAAGANMDNFYWEVTNRIQADPSGEIFRKFFGSELNGKNPAALSMKAMLGFAGGQLDNGYAAGARAAGGGGYVPQPIGKLSDLQQKYEDGEKGKKDPTFWEFKWPPFECFQTEVDDEGGITVPVAEGVQIYE